LFVDSTKVQNILGLISVFSGTSGGPSALVDLEDDVSGILPIISGGTGLNATGAYGTVLTSNGTGLSYQFIYDLVGAIGYSSGSSDANKIPKTDGYGLLDPSFMYKNPMYINCYTGNYNCTAVVGGPDVLTCCTFRFDNYILEGLSSIKLEAIINAPDSDGYVKLYDLTAASYINLVGSTPYITVAGGSGGANFVFVKSDDIKSLLSIGAVDHLYRIDIYTSAGDPTYFYMVRLTMEYLNPTGMPPVAFSSNFIPWLP
jgi:hypothetical protein